MDTSYDSRVSQVLSGKPSESMSDDSDIHSMAVKSLAKEMMSAFKSGNEEQLAQSLDLLCELCINKYEGSERES